MVDVAQLGRALRCGRSGCGFKSHRPPRQTCLQARPRIDFTKFDILAARNKTMPASENPAVRSVKKHFKKTCAPEPS